VQNENIIDKFAGRTYITVQLKYTIMKTSKILILVLLVSSLSALKAQDTTSQSNSQFNVELRRDSSENLTALVSLNDPAKCSAIIIEKGRYSNGDFRQCAYFDVKNAIANISIFEIKIDYPLTPVYDSYYRIKLVKADGESEIFPALLLPAKQSILPRNIMM
jgi:hypothetical protein